jgi:hypothetical protein
LQIHGSPYRIACSSADEWIETDDTIEDDMVDKSNPDLIVSLPISIWEGRQPVRNNTCQPVYLNIYHLNGNWERTNRFTGQFLGLGGAFHAGVEILGTEWSYGERGVSESEPRRHPENIYAQSIHMGDTYLSAKEISDVIEKLQDKWRGVDYDLFKNNCCSFSRTLCKKLVGKPIPGWVDRFAQIASTTGLEADWALDSDLLGFNLQTQASWSSEGSSSSSLNSISTPVTNRDAWLMDHELTA